MPLTLKRNNKNYLQKKNLMKFIMRIPLKTYGIHREKLEFR